MIGLAVGYTVEKIQNFILSYRQHSDDGLLFIIDNLTEEMETFFNDNDVMNYVMTEPINLGIIGFLRWELYRDVITEYFPDVENIITSDVRDVVFQDNPFKYVSGADLEFSSEPIKVGDCVKHNALWIRDIYGADTLEICKDNWVLCAGVVGGKRDAVLRLCDLIIEEGDRLAQIGKRTFTDQASLNVLYAKGLFPSSNINLTGQDMMATMHHSKILTFDREGYLLSENGNRIAMVHQYDRVGFASMLFLKNAMRVKGKAGVKIAAEYAARNIPDHDL